MKRISIIILLFIHANIICSQERIRLLNNVPYENIELNFSTDTADTYVFTERVANVSDGEIFWIKEEIDTITIKCLDNNSSEITYEIKESDNDWMGMLYDRKLYKLITEDISFPTIKYIKNNSTKRGIFPDSCQLSEFTIYHLNNRIRLLKELGDYTLISTYENLIEKIENCNVNDYNYLQQSRNLIGLDNYIIPTNSDTLKYEIVQIEHFGIKTKIASFVTEDLKNNKTINLLQYENDAETKKEIKNIVDLNKESTNKQKIKGYDVFINSSKSYSKAELQINEKNQLVRYISKINRYYINNEGKEQYRFYNYEIKKVPTSYNR